ncbi:MAG: glycoside hydrolase family 43 protein [Gemmatimonadaceae bacterium]|jgi:GH43 family beta-xylosidase|nr:glycoside hydrolase family 43 protein [Gemmatimonadaceae bacterium]
MALIPRTLPLVAVVALVACSSNGGGATSPGPQPTPDCTFINPLGSGADPWVVRRGALYHLVESRDDAIWVTRSTRLDQVKQNAVRVWTAPDTGWNSRNVWAPELHEIDGRWYIYYAAGRQGPPFLSQRVGVLQSEGSDPQGRYIDRGQLFTGDDSATTGNVWAIDMTVGRVNGRWWAVWSGWDENAATDRTPQHLYAAPLANPWTLAERRRRISSPVEPWERGTELALQEGPSFLVRGADTFIVYSTNESWLPAYRLGALRLRAGATTLDSTQLTKHGPLFSSLGTVYGPGHASFTTSPDSTEDWIVYHAKTSAAPGWERVIRTQRFAWRPDGLPDFGVPVPSGQRLTMPAGQCRA